jgi:hypothetical protein
VPASGEKESYAARHVRLNLRTQLLELLAEQRSQPQSDENSKMTILRGSEG